MHKTVYIEKDEEITAIVSKIKKEVGKDIFLVVPKGALLSQGMINLKLLKKEADRLEKELFIITGDEKAKKIIAKVGLKIRELSEEGETKEAFSPTDLFAEKASDEVLEVLDEKKEKVREIGSASFFERKELDKESAVPSGEKIKRKERSALEELNSRDLREDLYSRNNKADQLKETESDFEVFQKNKQKKAVFFEENPNPRHLEVREEEVKKIPIGKTFPVSQKTFQAEHFRQAEDFFSEKKDPKIQLGKKFFQDNLKRAEFQRKMANSETGKTGRAKWILMGVGLLFLFSFSGWAYWNWPKVNIKIYPRGTKINGLAEIKVSSDQTGAQVKGNYHEIEIEKTIQMPSSGTGSGSKTGKAVGKVIILNKFSSASQNLVATTRILSKEGKLFRLAKDVLVPGMAGETAGKIEATVMADKAGDEFNIGPSQFTIEGFKGGPKYEKFEVTSSEAMSGGGAGDGKQEAKIVLQKDIDAARVKAMDEIGKSLAVLVEEKIGQEEKYFLDSAGKEIVEAFADRRPKEEGEKFNYTVKEKIKLISFQEDELKKMVYQKIEKEMGENLVLEKDKVIFSYDKPVVDWDKKQMEVAVTYDGLILPQLNMEKIKKELAGKNEEALKDALTKYQQLEKAEMEYYPSWAGRWPALERNFLVFENKE